MLLKTFLSILFFSLSLAQEPLTSPCPRFFSYEPQRDRDRWYGILTLISEYDLTGITIRLVFDRPSFQLGNWFGRVEMVSNREYAIINEMHRLNANMPFALRFYLRYKGDVPKLVRFSLNSKVVCPEAIGGGLQSSGACIEVPAEATTTPRSSTVTSMPLQTRDSVALQAIDEQGDFFVGDFQLLMQPQIKTRVQTYNEENDFPCGSPAPQPLPLITHGHPTRLGQFPWHAAIYLANPSLEYLCGASLISKNYVITAASCLTKSQTDIPLPKEHLVVYLGKYYLNEWMNAEIQAYNVSQIFIHPQYKAEAYSDNLALIKTELPIRFTDFVRPICLGELGNVSKGVGTVVGWGFDHRGRMTGALNQAAMSVVSREVCVRSFPEFFEKFTTNGTFCAGLRNGTSVCNGDSGGGLAFATTFGEKNSEIWQLGGIVSASVAPQNHTKGCDLYPFAVFTDVAKYLDWIKTTMAN